MELENVRENLRRFLIRMPSSKVTQVMLETLDGLDVTLSQEIRNFDIPLESKLCLICQSLLLEQVLIAHKCEEPQISHFVSKEQKAVAYQLLAANAFFPLAIEVAVMLHNDDTVGCERAVRNILLKVSTRIDSAASPTFSASKFSII